MQSKTLFGIVFILSLALFIPSASAAPTQDDCELVAPGSETSGYVEVAGVLSSGHLGDFSSSYKNLYCNATMTAWGTNAQILSYSDSGSMQGHVSEPGVFGNSISGNWTACTVSAGACDSGFGEACLVGVTESGMVGGEWQGHAVSCGSTNRNICCCPSGSEWDGVSCVEKSSNVVITSIEGNTSPVKNDVHSYNFTVEWGWNSRMNWTFYQDVPPKKSVSGQNNTLRGTQTITQDFKFTRSGNLCAAAENMDQYGNDSTCLPISVACKSSGQGASSAAQCCSTLVFSKGKCVLPVANVNGTITLIESDKSPRLVTDAVVTITNEEDTWQDTTTTQNGYYEFDPVPAPDNYTVEAEYLDTFYNVSPEFEAQAMQNYTINLNLTEVEYRSDCTNTAGRCDRDAYGKNGCLMPGTPNRTQRQETLYACDPPGSAGRNPGDLVFVEQNATHRREALCCSEQGEWRPAPTAKIEGNVNNLIKYTRLTTYLGQPVRLVIATWN